MGKSGKEGIHIYWVATIGQVLYIIWTILPMSTHLTGDKYKVLVKRAGSKNVMRARVGGEGGCGGKK